MQRSPGIFRWAPRVDFDTGVMKMHLRQSARVDVPTKSTLAIQLVDQTTGFSSGEHFVDIVVYPTRCSKPNAVIVGNACR